MKTVEIPVAEAEFASLLGEVEQCGEVVQICRNGTAIAELRPPTPRDVFRQNPRLKVEFREDPSLPASNEEWPEEYR